MAVSVALAATAFASPVVAQTKTPESQEESSIEDARWEFAEGSAHYQAKRWNEALAAFERSHRLVESPNTELMIARCLRELGRKAEAAMRFEHATEEARRRVQRGETKYARTAEAAAAEGAVLRAQVGTVKIHVAHAATASVTVDGEPVPLSPEGDAIVLHDPGTVSVVVRDERGGQQSQTASVLAGAEVKFDFAAESAAPPPPVRPPPPPAPKTPWTIPAAWAAGGLTLAGLGVFTIFGLDSQATYDDLVERCGSVGCGPADRLDAEDGKRSQTIANVGLGIAIGAAVATAVFVVLSLANDDARARRAAIIRP